LKNLNEGFNCCEDKNPPDEDEMDRIDMLKYRPVDTEEEEIFILDALATEFVVVRRSRLSGLLGPVGSCRFARLATD